MAMATTTAFRSQGRHRDIGDIWPCCTDAMGWETVKSLALRPGLTLGGIDWRLIVNGVWQSAMEEGIRVCGVSGAADWHSEMHIETWHKIFLACNVDTFEGLQGYVEAWGESDPVVRLWVQGSEARQKPTADIGGWLAD